MASRFRRRPAGIGSKTVSPGQRHLQRGVRRDEKAESSGMPADAGGEVSAGSHDLSLDENDQFAQTDIVKEQVNLPLQFVPGDTGADRAGQDEALTGVDGGRFKMLHTEAAIAVSAMTDADQAHRVPGGIDYGNVHSDIFLISEPAPRLTRFAPVRDIRRVGRGRARTNNHPAPGLSAPERNSKRR